MDFNVWCIFASILIVSAGAARFDLGPQKFYETSSPAPRRDQNAAAKEVVLYLTPSQIKALEAGGAVVRPAEPENDQEEASEEEQQENEDQPEENVEQEQEQEQEQEEEQEETENEAEQPEQQEEAEQPEQEQENDEELQSQDLALEEILRILNEEQLEQEEATAEQALNEPQVTEETEEDSPEAERQVPPRFQARQNLQPKQQPKPQEKYLAPVAQKARSKAYASIRYQRNEQPQRTIVQFPRQQQQEPRENQEQPEQPQTEAPLSSKRYRLVPYEVQEQAAEPAQEQEQQTQQDQQAQQEEGQEQEAQPAEEQTTEQQENEERLSALLTPLLSKERIAEIISQRRNKLSQNELEIQAILKELKQTSKYNDQKYAIEIEKLRTMLLKQNSQAKAEAFAKTAPIKKDNLKRRPSQSAKLVKASASGARNPLPKSQKQRTARPQPVPVEVARPVPVPVTVVKTQKAEVPKPVAVETEKRVPVPVTRNVYVKINKPYLVERIVPVEIKKEIPVEIPIRKPQRLTILRHVWEH